MKWVNRRKIFDPTEHRLFGNCVEYAQSPQALVFDDFVRIYFSTREKDGKNYLSKMAFVDFDRSFRKIINVSKDPVISLGNLGCFDEHGIFPMNVLRYNDRIISYTTGWNRKKSVSNDSSIGFATSIDNGLTFQKLGEGPVLTASIHEPFLVADAFVTNYSDKFYMWYITGTKWIKDEEQIPQRVYKIVSAISDDGIIWTKIGRHLIKDKLNENECQALPTVIKVNDKYHMFFCYREAIGFRTVSEKAYRIGYAYSTDLINWHRDDDNAGISVSENGWDSWMQCYPHVFWCDEKIYMLYNGNEFGRFGFGITELIN